MAIGKFVNSFYIPIVPLPDGNGRMGRMWHSLLGKWKELFFWFPVEELSSPGRKNTTMPPARLTGRQRRTC